QNQPDGTYWVTGWPAPARAAVQVNNSYLLQAPAAPNFTSVEVKEIGGAGMGGIRFENNT
ncbi:MAG TPA: hypothetical protein VF665_15805, partial [Longimicrobium sp.]|uniref:hypothetical protein n=1 Tax=Longimicrobium sp. TaxID=2029185 RepID=UPI002EDAB827